MFRFLLSFFAGILVTTGLNAQILVGIAGGTGSGKTTLAEKLALHFGENAALIQEDCYYKDLSYLPYDERENRNFDHPESLDFDLLKENLINLKNNRAVDKPRYDFLSHTRTEVSDRVEPCQVIIVEGILIFYDSSIRELFDIKIYIETDDDIRILRRLERDIVERGRTIESIKAQYLATVKPMHKKFVEPSKDFADVVIYGINENFSIVTKLISGYLENEVLPGQYLH